MYELISETNFTLLYVGSFNFSLAYNLINGYNPCILVIENSILLSIKKSVIVDPVFVYLILFCVNMLVVVVMLWDRWNGVRFLLVLVGIILLDKKIKVDFWFK